MAGSAAVGAHDVVRATRFVVEQRDGSRLTGSSTRHRHEQHWADRTLVTYASAGEPIEPHVDAIERTTHRPIECHR